jgi:hypothetical protein
MTRVFKTIFSPVWFFFIVAYFPGMDSPGQPVDLPENFHTYTIENVNDPDPGHIFTFIRPQSPKYPGYLIIMDNYGTPLYYKYTSYHSGSFAVQRNGLISFLRNENDDKRFYLMDSSYVIVDSVRMENYLLDSHDFIAMENGHFLIFGLDLRIMDLSTVVEGGNPAATVKGCVIQELDADKNVVFEWNSFDHYELTDTYKDLTESAVDYVHPNSLEIDYDGNILLIARGMNEVTKIDRQTGDIIWRLGGKNNEFTFPDSIQMFSQPHDFRLLPDGNYTIFDNGNDRDPAYSRAIEYQIDQENKTIELVWEYDADKSVFGRSGGSTRRLPSGNTIIGYGGRISSPASLEVHPDGTTALQLNFNNDMKAGRTLKFPWKTTLLVPSMDTISFGAWDGYTEQQTYLTITNNGDEDRQITSVALHSDTFQVEEALPFTIPAGGAKNVMVVFYPEGSPEGAEFHDILTLNSDRDSTERVAIQVHLKGYFPDITSPVVTITPETDTVLTDAVFEVSFNEPVRLSDNTELTSENAGSVVIFREDDENGPDVPVSLEVNEEKTGIRMEPQSGLEASGVYYLGIVDMLEDHSDNTILQVEKTYQVVAGAGTHFLNTGSRFHIYPNPVNDVMHINTGGSITSYDLVVYDPSGQTLRRINAIVEREFHLDVSSLPPGIYFLNILDHDRNESIYLKAIKD